MVECGGREEEHQERNAYEYNWVIEVDAFASKSAEIKPHEEPEEEYEETWKLHEISDAITILHDYTYLAKLPPIEMVAGIILKHKDIINFRFVPNPACHAKQEK